MKDLLPPKIVGRLCAAVEHHAESGLRGFQMLVKALHPLKPRAGKRAAGEEDRITTLGKAIPGVAAGSPASFISKNCSMFRVDPFPQTYSFSTLVQRQSREIDLFRADLCAQRTETAFKGCCLVILKRRIENSQRLWSPGLLQEFTAFLTKTTLHALFQHHIRIHWQLLVKAIATGTGQDGQSGLSLLTNGCSHRLGNVVFQIGSFDDLMEIP
jgi:hypothetical protein